MLPEGYRAPDQSGRKVWIGGASPIIPLPLPLRTRLAYFWNSRTVPALGSSSYLWQGFDPNAESPAISSDGRSVAFIREEKGRGTLWVSRLNPPLSAHQVAGDAYDVRDVTFAPSGLIMFGAKVNGRISILA